MYSMKELLNCDIVKILNVISDIDMTCDLFDICSPSQVWFHYSWFHHAHE